MSRLRAARTARARAPSTARGQRGRWPPLGTRRAVWRHGRVSARAGADRTLRDRAADRGQSLAGTPVDAARRAGRADAADDLAGVWNRLRLGAAQPRVARHGFARR